MCHCWILLNFNLFTYFLVIGVLISITLRSFALHGHGLLPYLQYYYTTRWSLSSTSVLYLNFCVLLIILIFIHKDEFLESPIRLLFPARLFYDFPSSSSTYYISQLQATLAFAHWAMRFISIRHANINACATCWPELQCTSSSGPLFNPFNKLIAQLCSLLQKGRDGATAQWPERTPHDPGPTAAAAAPHDDGSLQQTTVHSGLWWTSSALEEWWHYRKEFGRLKGGWGRERTLWLYTDGDGPFQAIYYAPICTNVSLGWLASCCCVSSTVYMSPCLCHPVSVAGDAHPVLSPVPVVIVGRQHINLRGKLGYHGRIDGQVWGWDSIRDTEQMIATFLYAK